jgi:hypothetical protein
LAFCSVSGKFKVQTVRSNAVLAVERTAANPRTCAPACELITRLRASTASLTKTQCSAAVERTFVAVERTCIKLPNSCCVRAQRACVRARTPYSSLLRSNAPSLRSNAPLLPASVYQKTVCPVLISFCFDQLLDLV